MVSNYPFDVLGFIRANKPLVKKFLKKNTYKLKVEDFDPSEDYLYSGQPSILNRKASFEYSELQKLEYIKCLKDCVYFTRKYVKIISIDDGIIPFDLYDYQEDLLNKFQKNRHVISLQARQTGKTQTTAAFLLHFALFTPAKNIAILANKASQAREILQRVQLSYELLPYFLKQGVISYNKGSTKFVNNSEIFCGSSSSASIRGKSISCVISDTKIKVRNKETGKEEEITIKELEKRLRLYKYNKNAFNNVHALQDNHKGGLKEIQTYQGQEIIENDIYEVLTPGGWSDFDGLLITTEKEVIELDNLTCTPNHLIEINGTFVEASTLEHKKVDEKTTVYDLLNVEKENKYFTNDVVSHNCLYIDECAFLRDDMEFYESTYPTISSGKESRIIVTSTPNGARGLFYKLWEESVNGINTFNNLKVPWNKVPGRDLKWKEEQIKNTSEEQFRQEHELVFRGSQNSLLSASVLESLVTNKPIWNNQDLNVYADPIEGRTYFITVDTARGVGGDYSACIVFDITDKNYSVVARYKNNRISPLAYPRIVHDLATHYNDAYVLVEVNDIGEQVGNILFYDYEYENLLMCCTEGRSQVIGFQGDSAVGVRTTAKVKNIGCANVKTMIEKGVLSLYDSDLIDEFGTFVPKGKSYEADSGAHDDLVMCCVLFAWAMTQQYMIDIVDNDSRIGMRQSDSLAHIIEDMPAFGIICTGEDEFIPTELGTQNSFFNDGTF